MTVCFRWLCALAVACAAVATNAHAATYNVLWYSYAHAQSEYKSFYRTLATSGTPHSTGDTWNLTFFGPGDPPPNFAAYNVLVIHSGEAFRTGIPGGVNADVPYTWAANRTRPLCAYALIARYNGSGSLEEAANFVCLPPP